MESIAALEFSKTVFEIINATGGPAKQEDISPIMVANKLFISLRIRCYKPECVSGALNTA